MLHMQNIPPFLNLIRAGPRGPALPLRCAKAGVCAPFLAHPRQDVSRVQSLERGAAPRTRETQRIGALQAA